MSTKLPYNSYSQKTMQTVDEICAARGGVGGELGVSVGHSTFSRRAILHLLLTGCRQKTGLPSEEEQQN